MSFISIGPAVLSLACVAQSASAQVKDKPAETLAESSVIALSLDEAVQLAVGRSFRAARARRNQASSELRKQNARSGYLPRVDLGVAADHSLRSYEEQGIDYDPYAGRNFRGGINSSLWFPVDISGNVKRQVEQADTQRQISSFEVSHAMLDVAFDAQNAYLNALRAQLNVDADQRVVEQIRDLLERSRTGAPGAVPFLEVELGNAQQSLTNSRTNADQAQDGLKQALRMPLETRLHLTTKMTQEEQPELGKDLLNRAMKSRPDVQQARLRIRAAEISERQTADWRKPTLSVGGYMNQEMIGSSPMDGDRRRISNRGLGVNVKVPIAQYDGGQLARQKRIAGINKEQAMADAQELEERVGYDLRQALLAVERAENRIASVPDKKQAFDALERAEQQMLAAPAGTAQSLLAQVSNARNAWRSAETASADAYIDYNRAVFRLRRTLGDTEALSKPAIQDRLSDVPLVGAGTP